MRTVTARAEGEDWIDDVEDHFNDALEVFEDHPNLQASKAEPSEENREITISEPCV